jgi:hypothetical protein
VYNRDAAKDSLATAIQRGPSGGSEFSDSGVEVSNVQNEWAYSIPGQMGEWNAVLGDFMLDDPWNFLQDGDSVIDNMMVP